MNHKMKLIVAAAVAAFGIAGQAQALTASTVTSSGSLYLYVFEDRTLNPAATNSAVFDLGLASDFNPAANLSLDLSSNSAWTSYVATIANPANIKWGVFGVTIGTGSAGSTVLTTNVAANTVKYGGGTINSSVSNYSQEMTVYASANGFNVVTPLDAASGKWANRAGGAFPTDLTAGLDQNLDFYKYVSTGTKTTNYATQTAYAMADGTQDYFNLSHTGTLTYTATAAIAPVPEADTYALMLAGMGLVGFMARRRRVG